LHNQKGAITFVFSSYLLKAVLNPQEPWSPNVIRIYIDSDKPRIQ